uniref:Uncharacterized protein n=1 Tax=Glossina brevipalpis TaxID=37001 RepID=A0A1A9WZ15_9MUSC
MKNFEMQDSGSEYLSNNDSETELQEAFARGDLRPGLSIELQKSKEKVNNVARLLTKTDEIKIDLPWLERMDMTNDLAPLAPELALALEKHEQKRANMFKGNAKIPYLHPEEDPVLNDFKREMLFHRQAQAAVLEGIKNLHELGVKTKRPDDYFAEMTKTDEHMQKVRANLIAKQEGQAKSERIRQIRLQRKMGKLMDKQLKVERENQKREMLENIKKFRKGKFKNLDFLEDSKKLKIKTKKSSEGRKNRNKKFGFGGRKKDSKRNTKSSSAGLESNKFPRGKSFKAASSKKRLGKSRRLKAKSKN